MFFYGIKDVIMLLCCNVSLSLELSNIFCLQLQTCKLYKYVWDELIKRLVPNKINRILPTYLTYVD
jgi:hypothetical protein